MPGVKRWAALGSVPIVAAIALPLAVILTATTGALVAITGDAPSAACVPGASAVGAISTAPAPAAGKFTAEQVTIARTAAQIADQRRLPGRAKLIILATGFQESGIRNLDYGDRDSLGWLQQRAGWGSAKQRQNPAYAAGKFFDVLVTVPGWESLPVTRAAQAVQRSGLPYAYAKWEPAARSLLAVLGDTSAEPCETTSPDEAGNPGKVVSGGREGARAAGLRLGASSVGTYPGHQPSMHKAWDFMATGATGQRIADHFAANRKAYGISYIIWNRRILRDYPKGAIPAGTWAPYFDGGSSNPSRAHTNHVHTSYY